jgi:hypothetical protein
MQDPLLDSPFNDVIQPEMPTLIQIKGAASFAWGADQRDLDTTSRPKCHPECRTEEGKKPEKRKPEQ